MTHTPGPWTIDDTGPHEFEEGHVELNIWGPDGAYFGAIAAIRNDYSGDMDSNARLIAAAPDYHKLAQFIAADIRGGRGSRPDWLVMLDEAIAKAEGR